MKSREKSHLKNCRPCWYTKLHFGKNHVDSKEGLARLRSSAHYMWNMLRCCCWLKFCLLLLLFFSHTKVFFTSAEIARRHISTQPENCSTRFLSKSKICKKGIFCKNPSIVVFPQTFECQKSLLSIEVKIASQSWVVTEKCWVEKLGKCSVLNVH